MKRSTRPTPALPWSALVSTGSPTSGSGSTTYPRAPGGSPMPTSPAGTLGFCAWERATTRRSPTGGRIATFRLIAKAASKARHPGMPLIGALTRRCVAIYTSGNITSRLPITLTASRNIWKIQATMTAAEKAALLGYRGAKIGVEPE